ncbi:ESCRT-III subunit protein VPS20 KNAG_0A06680 [Huiozyma naganishii CBS 8797]|uniref:Vacuolar protein sorting-associated protein 20 n=1 Tax=Huiozyma naganishii (strain ATCC MYA-139 / BCRC 22969 / CBS 8797 / KCTC 17520 / NBRC 10181 / NCYC 3082 / Yp74L-3) TaxID=1071383 RepID=J7S2R9_HUIN7|nr:hypothetical protein KNAG_0A06680 [Kazachstania naganishii CBS 8797]CCK68324.1 hypothetical protein KNAG_0A06680 [Kazachstania naganishii CBS 8797]
MGQKGSKIEITETDRAVLQLKRSKDDIHRFSRRTDELISTEKLQLKKLIKENPKDYKSNLRVRLLLKKIHYQSHLLQQASDQLVNLENMLANIEFKLVEVQFLQGLQRGNEILTKLNKEFDNVDEVMDNVQEQIQYQEEINNTLSQSVIGVDNFEEEIDKELDDLDKEINPVSEIEMPSVQNLPELPLKNAPLSESADNTKGAKKEEGDGELIALSS